MTKFQLMGYLAFNDQRMRTLLIKKMHGMENVTRKDKKLAKGSQL